MAQKQKNSTTFQVGRNAGNGQFITVQQARQMRDRAVVETMKVPSPQKQKHK